MGGRRGQEEAPCGPPGQVPPDRWKAQALGRETLGSRGTETAGSGAKPLVGAPAGGEEKTGEGRGAPGGLEPALLGSGGWGLAQGHGTVRVELGL